jgi:hypothetical protein
MSGRARRRSVGRAPVCADTEHAARKRSRAGLDALTDSQALGCCKHESSSRGVGAYRCRTKPAAGLLAARFEQPQQRSTPDWPGAAIERSERKRGPFEPGPATSIVSFVPRVCVPSPWSAARRCRAAPPHCCARSRQSRSRDQKRELYGRALVVVAAEQYASRLVVPTSQRAHPTSWASHKDLAAKALKKLAAPHLPASLKQLQNAVQKAHREYANCERTALEQAREAHRQADDGAPVDEELDELDQPSTPDDDEPADDASET